MFNLDPIQIYRVVIKSAVFDLPHPINPSWRDIRSIIFVKVFPQICRIVAIFLKIHSKSLLFVNRSKIRVALVCFYLHSSPEQLWLLVMTLWLCTYNPVKIDDLLGQPRKWRFLQSFTYGSGDKSIFKLYATLFEQFESLGHKIHRPQLYILIVCDE